MLVYYYMQTEGYNQQGDKINFLKNNLENKHLKISRLKALNDIFEFLSHDQSNPSIRNQFKDAISAKRKTQGFISFSRSWRSPVMWGHYGHSNQGACLGFEIEDKRLSRINYITERMTASKNELLSLNIASNFLDVLLSTKFADWSYEKEMRLPVGLDSHEGESNEPAFAPFDEIGILKKIFVGAFSSTSRSQLDEWVNGYPHPVEMLKTRAAFQTFEICSDKRGLN
ncbi:DUF2971 domain-containing protein [Pseudovibrio ascidiaceicola]|uniref:DUF2971 domain-containing protein n=1 Tax=Pseudovibrio ascidiaceicola TaxID=285279 RepID=UPI003D369A93